MRLTASVGSVFAYVGVMMFQAGATSRDQQLEEFGVFGGNGMLRRGYIRLDVLKIIIIRLKEDECGSI